MVQKNTDSENYNTLITLNEECDFLLKEQRKKNPEFNFSAWVRDRIKEHFMSEDLLKKQKKELLNKAKELDTALKLLQEKEAPQ